MWSLIFVIHT
jgi:hypothetical protein